MVEEDIEAEDYIDVKEACRLLAVKAATLYAYVSRGVLRSYKQGIKRQRLYRRSEIMRLLAVRPSDEEQPEPAANKRRTKGSEIPAAEDWIPYF